MAGDQSQERAARNENLFRQVNDRLHDLAVIDGSPDPLERFVCECDRTSCSLVVELTAAEYLSVRNDARRFLVFPDPSHTSPELETVVERRERYWVVEKRGTAGVEAEHLADEGPNLL